MLRCKILVGVLIDRELSANFRFEVITCQIANLFTKQTARAIYKYAYLSIYTYMNMNIYIYGMYRPVKIISFLKRNEIKQPMNFILECLITTAMTGL